MGEAKRRGSLEDRKNQALARDHEFLEKYCESEEDKKLLSEMGEAELRSGMRFFKLQEELEYQKQQAESRKLAITEADERRKAKKAKKRNK